MLRNFLISSSKLSLRWSLSTINMRSDLGTRLVNRSAVRLGLSIVLYNDHMLSYKNRAVAAGFA